MAAQLSTLKGTCKAKMASLALQLMLTSSFVGADLTVLLPQKERRFPAQAKAARCPGPSSEPGCSPTACRRKGTALMWVSSSVGQTDQSTFASLHVPSWASPFQPQRVTGEEGKIVPPLFKKRPTSLILTELEEPRMSRLVMWVARTKCYEQTKTCAK